MTTTTAAAVSARSVTLRGVVASDAGAMERFIAALCPASRRSRFHGAVNGASSTLLRHLTQVDGRSHVAYVACIGAEIVGEACYVVGDDGRRAEFAIAVADDHQGLGVAAALLAELTGAARRAGLDSLHGDVLGDNERMIGFMRRQGFERGADPWTDTGPGVDRWELCLPFEPRIGRAGWPVPSLAGLLGHLTARLGAFA